MFRRVTLVQSLAGALLLTVAGAASAHTSSPMLSAPAAVVPATPAAPASIAAAAPGADGPLWPWLAPLVLLPLLFGRRGPKLVAATLAAVLVVFAAESAVHSVHHGLAGEKTAVCPIASAAEHVAGADVGTIAVDGPVFTASNLRQDLGPIVAQLRPLSPYQGRAPPSALA
jgi:hypothetical protein